MVYPAHARRGIAQFPSMGLAYLASYIMGENPELRVRVIDFMVEEFSPERLKQELDDFAPDIVGISVITLNYSGGKHVAKLTREFAPNSLVVMGGVHATIETDDCLNHCDIVVRGEGEKTLNEIIEGNELSSIKGISYHHEGTVVHNEARELIEDLDEVPFPAIHLFQMDKYQVFPSWGVMGSRGCPYNCAFCSSPYMWGRRIRFRSVSNVVDEIELLYNNYGVRSISFEDDGINMPQDRAFELCDELIRRGLHKKLEFFCQLRANTKLVSLEMFQKLREANIVRFNLGVESASARVLKSMGKSLSPAESKRAVKLARKAGMPRVVGNFLIGNWDETIWDVMKTWWFVISTNIEPQFVICTPYPETQFCRRLKENGYLGEDIDWASYNRFTAIARTNKMSKRTIFLVYGVSVIIQLIFTSIRGRDPKYAKALVVGIVANLAEKAKIRFKRAKSPSTMREEK